MHIPTHRQIRRFWKGLKGYPPFPVQLAIHRRILESALGGLGDTIVVLMTRQFGKNETSSAVGAHLLVWGRSRGPLMSNLKFAPVDQPQAALSRDRLAATLGRHPIMRGVWRLRDGHRFEMGNASASILSLHPTANVVGLTATHLLEADEAQDIDPVKWYRDAEPMAAFWNATQVFWGVGGARDALIHQKLRVAQEREAGTGRKCVFRVTAQEAARLHPPYAAHYERVLAEQGPDSLVVRTQYGLEFVDAMERFIDEEALERLYDPTQTLHAAPRPGVRYVAGLDLAGGPIATDAWEGDFTRPRDRTVLTIAEVQSRSLSARGTEPHPLSPPPAELPLPACASGASAGEGPGVGFPVGSPGVGSHRPRVVVRHWLSWKDVAAAELLPQLLEALRYWRVQRAVVDATGIGEPITSLLAHELGGRIVPFTFTAQGKSHLGYAVEAAMLAGEVAIPARAVPGQEGRWRQCRRELERLERRLGPGGRLGYAAPDHKCGDDFAISLFLSVWAAHHARPVTPLAAVSHGDADPITLGGAAAAVLPHDEGGLHLMDEFWPPQGGEGIW